MADEEGNQVGIMRREEALKLAQEKGLAESYPVKFKYRVKRYEN